MPPKTPGESKRGCGERERSGDDTDADSAAGVRQRSRKVKVVADFSPEEEQVMVRWLEAHPIIYNKKMTSYKDIGQKEKMWLEKAAEMGKPVAVLRTWYTSLRSRFGRLKKRRSEDAEMTERDKWIVRHFNFLHPHVYEVRKRTSMKQKLAAASTIAEELYDNPDQPSSTTTRPAQPTPTPSSLPPLEAEEALLASLEERSHQMMALQQQVLHRLRPSADRERDAFVDWVRSVIHGLDYGLWRRCQQELSSTLYRYIGENDQLKSQQEPAPAPSIKTEHFEDIPQRNDGRLGFSYLSSSGEKLSMA